MLLCWIENRPEILESGKSHAKLTRALEDTDKGQVVYFGPYRIEFRLRLRKWPINLVAENDLRYMQGAFS